MTATAVRETAARPHPADTGVHHDVLTLRCPQQSGIVNAVTSFLVEHGLDIEEHQQFDDRVSGTLFLRTAFTGRDADTLDDLRRAFATVVDRFGMDARFHDATPDRLLIMVSKFGHCLNDLIFRWRAGTLGAESPAWRPTTRTCARWPRRPDCRSSTSRSPPTPSPKPRRGCRS